MTLREIQLYKLGILTNIASICYKTKTVSFCLQSLFVFRINLSDPVSVLLINSAHAFDFILGKRRQKRIGLQIVAGAYVETYHDIFSLRAPVNEGKLSVIQPKYGMIMIVSEIVEKLRFDVWTLTQLVFFSVLSEKY